MKFISKDLAIKLKEKGFDKPCFNAYNAHGCQYLNGWCEYLNERDTDFIYSSYLHDKDCLCPTVNQVLEWLREKDVYIWIEPYNTYVTKNHLAFQWNITVSDFFKGKDQFDDKDTLYTHIHLDIEHWKENYDDACIAGIEYVINNLI